MAGPCMELSMLNTELIQVCSERASDALTKAQVAKPEIRGGCLAEVEGLLMLARLMQRRPCGVVKETRRLL